MPHSANYQALGPIGHITPPDSEVEQWRGNISVAKRIKKEELTRRQVQTALQPDALEPYFTVAATKASTRCIDGRQVVGYGTPEAPADRTLGAQVPGGTATAALCWRVASWGNMFTEGFTLSGDMNVLNDHLGTMGIKAGGHIDDQAKGHMTGCGAIDKVPDILRIVTTPEAQEQVRGILHLLLGESYDREVADGIVGRLVSLQGKKDEYFDKDRKTGNLRYRQQIIEALKKRDPTGIEELVGAHHEVALLVNLVPGTTFDRDKFSADHDGKIQAFNYDFWLTLQAAEELFPIKVRNSAEKATLQQHLRQRYVTARALFAIGTAMVLTDGSLELIVRTPTAA